MELKANSSNNTVYADADGHIAYFHGNYIPKRDTHFDFTKPVDGSDPATEWQGLMTVDEAPHLLDPKSGYLFNVNDSPWNGAGESSLHRQDFPAYVETGNESARGLHAMRLLQGKTDFTLDGLVAAAYDSYLPWFIKPLRLLLQAWTNLPANSEMKTSLAPQIAVLRAWDMRWGVNSVATTLAIYWGQEMTNSGRVAGYEDEFSPPGVPGDVALKALAAASDKLKADFGTWQVPWGEINRFQRLTDDIVQPFDDSKPSLPVGFAPSQWGALASFDWTKPRRTKKIYGADGNSFVAAVEFGPTVHAKAIMSGGESGDPASPHFTDQALMFSQGRFRDVLFSPEEVRAHAERSYHP
jgi:acyl-homoserine-lactone acylase